MGTCFGRALVAGVCFWGDAWNGASSRGPGIPEFSGVSTTSMTRCNEFDNSREPLIRRSLGVAAALCFFDFGDLFQKYDSKEAVDGLAECPT